jgi:hypothetical protein
VHLRGRGRGNLTDADERARFACGSIFEHRQVALFAVAAGCGPGQHEHHVDAHAVERFDEAVASHAQPAGDHRREFPAQHEDFHVKLPTKAPPRAPQV